MTNSVLEKLEFLYGKENAGLIYPRLRQLIEQSKEEITYDQKDLWDEKDIALITYPDSFKQENLPGLQTLNSMLNEHAKEMFSIVHILPFYPYSSDRGFSITDFMNVKKEFGDWQDISAIAINFRLMADFVLNHVSAKHEWFQRFLSGDDRYWNYFIHFAKDEIPTDDIEKVHRARTTPLLTKFTTAKGERWVWTTYSTGTTVDQIDLNYKNPEVILAMVSVLINLIKRKVRIIRLDAVGVIWKELGTSCDNLPQAHVLVQLFREIVRAVCPSVLLITETSRLPYEENVKYFGNGTNEAHMVYNFSLAPLILHSFYEGSTDRLSAYAAKLKTPTATTTFFNPLDIHDGLGAGGARNVLNEDEFQNLCDEIQKKGGKFSMMKGKDGQEVVKELNITWWSALNDAEDMPFELQLQRYITSRAIQFSLPGIPAVYYLSLFGGRNDSTAFHASKVPRDINRTSFSFEDISKKLRDNQGREARIIDALKNLIAKRRKFPAFHPGAASKVLELDQKVFAMVRGERGDQVLALHNISKDSVKISVFGKEYSLDPFSYRWESYCRSCFEYPDS